MQKCFKTCDEIGVLWACGGYFIATAFFTVSDKDISDTHTWCLQGNLIFYLIILLMGKITWKKVFNTTLNLLLMSLLDTEWIPERNVLPSVVWANEWVHDGPSDVQQSLCVAFQYWWKHAEGQREHTSDEECPLESRKTRRLFLSPIKFLYHYKPTENLSLLHI